MKSADLHIRLKRFAEPVVLLASVATSLTVRDGEQAPYITDNGNLILDLRLAEGIGNAPTLAAKLNAMIGVVEPDCSSA